MKHFWMLWKMNIISKYIQTIREESEPENKEYPPNQSFPLNCKTSKEVWKNCKDKIPHKSNIINRSCKKDPNH